MNYLLHRQKCQKNVVKLPPGLGELMSDISREVLRQQPNDTEIFKFIADYLDALLTTRQRAAVSNEILENIIETSTIIGEVLKKNGIDMKRAKAAATVIQTAFRDYIKRKEEAMEIAKDIEFDEFRIFKELVCQCGFSESEMLSIKGIIRLAFRDFFRKYSKLLKTAFVCGHDVWPCVENTFKYYSEKIPSYEAMDQAATKIQASYRRHLVRKAFSMDTIYDKGEDDLNNLERSNTAASIIQNAYRQYKQQIEQEKQRIRDKKKAIDEQKTIASKSRAATKIQAIYRGFIARKKNQPSRPSYCRSETDMDKPLSLETSSQVEFRKDVHEAIVYAPKDRSLRESAAAQVQLEFKKLLTKKKAEILNAATVKIQQLYRKIKKQRSLTPSEELSQEDQAAKLIQDTWRDFVARHSFTNETVEDIRKEVGKTETNLEVAPRKIALTEGLPEMEKETKEHLPAIAEDVATLAGTVHETIGEPAADDKAGTKEAVDDAQVAPIPEAVPHPASGDAPIVAATPELIDNEADAEPKPEIYVRKEGKASIRIETSDGVIIEKEYEIDPKDIPDMLEIPEIPGIPEISDIPGIPEIPDIPDIIVPNINLEAMVEELHDIPAMEL